LLLLSARTPSALDALTARLNIFLRQNPDVSLPDIAYTLQVGREAMECRLAIIAGSIAALQTKLREYLAGNGEIENLYQGEVKRNKDTMAFVAEDEELQDAAVKWIARGKYGRLLSLWVKGFSFDWKQLYANVRLTRIGLPTYPFGGDRYWLPTGSDTARKTHAFETVSEPSASLVTLTPVWEPVAAEPVVSWPSATDRVAIVGGAPARKAALQRHYPHARQFEIPFWATPEIIGEQLRALGTIDHIVWLAPEASPVFAVDEAVIEEQQQGVMQCFRLIKALLQRPQFTEEEEASVPVLNPSEHPLANAGFDLLRAKDRTAATKAQISAKGWSLWVTPKLGTTGWEALIRHDDYLPNDAIHSQKQKRDIDGIAYWVPNLSGKTVAILFDRDQLKRTGLTPAVPNTTNFEVKMLVNF